MGRGSEATWAGDETGSDGPTTVERGSEATWAGIRTGTGVRSTAMGGKSEASLQVDRLIFGVGDRCDCFYQIQAMVGDVSARWTQATGYCIKYKQLRDDDGEERQWTRVPGRRGNRDNHVCLFVCLLSRDHHDELQVDA
jgi:hypothetical protein